MAEQTIFICDECFERVIENGLPDEPEGWITFYRHEYIDEDGEPDTKEFLFCGWGCVAKYAIRRRPKG